MVLFHKEVMQAIKWFFVVVACINNISIRNRFWFWLCFYFHIQRQKECFAWSPSHKPISHVEVCLCYNIVLLYQVLPWRDYKILNDQPYNTSCQHKQKQHSTEEKMVIKNPINLLKGGNLKLVDLRRVPIKTDWNISLSVILVGFFFVSFF